MGRHLAPLAGLTIRATTLLVCLCAIESAGAFELTTHERISEAAFRTSVLGGDYLERELALAPGRLLRGIFSETRSPEGWIREGSQREDDLNLISWQPVRVRHHFYDPVYDRPLSAPGVGALGSRAPDWALEMPEAISGQEFSWRDARRAFHNALTAEHPTDREVNLARTFLTLGHVIHLIQDMAVPEHTRNDWHAGLLGPVFPAGTPSIFEKHIKDRESKFALDTYSPPRFDQLRHFWATGDGRGLAEFTNRNFLSKDTAFETFEEGAVGRDRRTGHVYPSPQLRLGLREDVDITTLPNPPRGLSGPVTFYLRDVDDRITGEVLENRRMISLSLFDAELRRRGAEPIFTVNRYVVDDAASLLLPRAVGYSAALLDYFFRGRLDGDVVAPDPTQPDQVRFDGHNGSPERLDGTLTLYGEDVTGTRTPLTPVDLGADLTVRAGAGEAVRSALFRASSGAERFVAVYQGRLGNETPGVDPGRDPGAVIGKVVGGVRVEQIFSDGTEWRIRTSKGVFGFAPALGTADYELVKWGDARDLFVARTRFGPAEANRVDAYRVLREANSVDLRTGGSGAAARVLIEPAGSATLPREGIPTGVSVDFRQTSIHRQTLIKNDTLVTLECVTDPVTGLRGNREAAREERPGQILAPPASVVQFARRFPLVLDPAHLFGGVEPVPDYTWFLTDVTVDPAGRILAVVLVTGLVPAVEPVTVPVWGIHRDTGELVVIADQELAVRYPQGGETFLWALVDLESRRTLLTTAEPEIVLGQTAHSEAAPEIWDRVVITGGCDPAPQTFVSRTFAVGLAPDDVIEMTPQTVQAHLGEDNIVIAGLLRPDLRAALAPVGFTGSQVSAIVRTAEPFVYHCTGRAPRTCRALVLDSRFTGAGRNPAYLEDARRPVRSGSG